MAEESASDPSGGFGVRPADVIRHATSVDDVATRVDQARSASATVGLGRDAYGVLCSALPSLFDPAQRTAVDAFRDSVDALQRTADDLRAAATGYRGADRSTAELIGDG
ncbi:type VII secretion target [Cryptosporangium sp. NPDC051539]|uniref:type VII secretion target n=1 Tax=Cryptosporangium sp. NPDC051539 TaxID=3363962 RepID=UPI0037BD7B2D